MTITEKMPNHLSLRIVIVEDDVHLLQLLTKILAHLGHDVRGVVDGASMDAALAAGEADIVVLDLNLPGENGMSIAQRLRKTSDCGIIMTTGRGAVDDKVQGFNNGADIYLVKPVDPLELNAALVSLAKRLTTLRKPGWKLDAKRSILCTPNNIEVPLSAQKCILLNLLFDSPGEIIPRTTIYAAIGYPDDEYARQKLETMLTRLRNDVRGADPESELPVRARHNMGYAFLADTIE